MSGDRGSFGCPWRDCCGILRVEVRILLTLLQPTGQCPTAKNYLTPNANNVKVENSDIKKTENHT